MSAITQPAQVAQQRFSWIKEVTRGTTPTNPAYYIVPVIPGQSSLQQVIQNIRSAVNQAPRMGGKVIGGTIAAQAQITMPIAKETTFEHFLESALSGEFGSFIDTAAITGTFEADDDTFTRASGSFLTDAIADRLRVGDLVAISGASTNATTTAEALDATETEIDLTSAANFPTPASGSWEAVLIENEWITYTGKSTNTLTGCTRGAFGSTAASHSNGVDAYPVKEITALSATAITFGNHPCVDEASVAITFKTRKKQLIGGTTRIFGTLERQHPDTAVDIFSTVKGCEVDTMALTIPAAGETNAQFNFVGQEVSGAQVSGATYQSALGNSPMSGTVADSIVRIDNAASTTCFETLQINVSNSRVGKYGVGGRYACFVEEGDREVTIQLSAYRVDETFLDHAIDGDRFPLELVVRDQEDGHGYRFIFPNCVVESDPGGTSGETVTDSPTILSEYSTSEATNIIVESLLGN